jgi:hypothetical protein
MHTNDTPNAATTSAARMQEGAQQIAALRDEPAADDSHIAEHIRGMVAATMGHLPTDASDTTRAHAAQWQEWALGAADGMALPVAG